MSKKALIVYYSQGSSVAHLKDLILNAVDADVCRIEALEPYPEDYASLVKTVNAQVQKGVDPAYKPVSVDISSYDTIFVGTPNWSGTLALPLRTFLKEHDFANKKVLPFLSHGGAGIENIEEDLHALCPSATICEPFMIQGQTDEETEADLNVWLYANASDCIE